MQPCRHRPWARGLAIVRLPSTIPNDLLVCPSWAPQEFKERDPVRQSGTMPSEEIAVGDFAPGSTSRTHRRRGPLSLNCAGSRGNRRRR